MGLPAKLAVLLGTVILVAFGLVYLVTSSLATGLLREQELRSLAEEVRALGAVLVRLADEPPELDLALAEAARLSRLETVQLLNRGGETMAPRNCRPAEVLIGRERLTALSREGEGQALVSSPAAGELFVVLEPLTGGGHLFAARSAAAFHERNRLLQVLLVTWGAVVLLAILLAGWVVLRTLVIRPIERLLADAGEIAAGIRAGPPAATGQRGDEFGLLRQALAGMADRLAQDRTRIEEQVAALTEMNRRLSEARDQLVRTEKLASVGQLAAGVAHEIGNPLGVVLGYAEMLEDERLDQAQRQEAVQQIQEATRRIRSTLRELLDFSRPATDEERVTDLARQSEDLLRFLAPNPRFRNHRLELDGSAAPPGPAAIPPSRFKQVLLNILFNAADATRANPGAIEITIGQRQGRATVAVGDRGPGIDPQLMVRIFDPFFTTKEVGEGTGLGLFVCHTILSRYGGAIEVANRPGGGALFTLVLPLAGATEVEEDSR